MEIVEQDLNVMVTKGEIKFPEYSKLKDEALQVAEMVRNMSVNEDNVKETKRTLAKVNKSVRNLEDRRIAIKKEIMEPYKGFEKDVKEIVNIVKGADKEVRDKVKELEELERLAKKEEINELWNARIKQYPFDFVKFDDFIDRRHLLKSTTITSIEKDMVDFLEGIVKDINVIEYMDDDRILTAYKDLLSVDEAVERVKAYDKEKEAYNEQIEGQEVITNAKSVEKSLKTVQLTIHADDFEVVKILLDKHNVEFIKS